MNFRDCVSRLGADDWQQYVPYIEDSLKSELQGTKGFIRLIKSENEKNKKNKIDELIQSFANIGVIDLDEKVNQFTSTLLRINGNANIALQYDLVQIILKHTNLVKFVNLDIVRSEIIKNSLSSVISNRLCAILFKISNQSLSQGNKSNAGQAGESFVNAILRSVGLEPNIHYREQYKSQSGSDTDFAFPCVEDFNDSKLEILVAVQMSTNDRARLTSSELKQGVIGYVVTGNGLDASSKKLKDIGSQIISTYEKSNIRIVCFCKEIQFEIERIKAQLAMSPNNLELVGRLRYFQNNTLSFQEFAEKMKKYRL